MFQGEVDREDSTPATPSEGAVQDPQELPLEPQEPQDNWQARRRYQGALDCDQVSNIPTQNKLPRYVHTAPVPTDRLRYYGTRCYLCNQAREHPQASCPLILSRSPMMVKQRIKELQASSYKAARPAVKYFKEHRHNLKGEPSLGKAPCLLPAGPPVPPSSEDSPADEAEVVTMVGAVLSSSSEGPDPLIKLFLQEAVKLHAMKDQLSATQLHTIRNAVEPLLQIPPSVSPWTKRYQASDFSRMAPQVLAQHHKDMVNFLKGSPPTGKIFTACDRAFKALEARLEAQISGNGKATRSQKNQPKVAAAIKRQSYRHRGPQPH
ncbi:hypothetical protein IE53DRAFT_366673 [Violaceomyces palustris]|uniref:Uncharacterized protein n=1 Tax=Violaceomyces palustris TaxID=1673888 RepID=A0ACD0P4P2_9BASI|nr:hypothetical protein IE53DRAFT_366673 [Violaceomyces palustris]